MTGAPEVLRATELGLGSRVVDVSLTIEPGSRVVIVGPNGAGKSSLLRLLLGLERPSRGRVTLGYEQLTSLSPRERAARIGWLPQRVEPDPSWLPLDLIAAARFRFAEGAQSGENTARSVLESLDALHLWDRRMGTLSGGEVQRVLLAALLAQDPPIALVDEPSNHLDPYHQRLTYDLLRTYAEQGRTLVVVTHDLGLASLLGAPANVRVVALERGHLALDTLLDDPLLPARLSELYGVRVGRALSGQLHIDWRDQDG